MSQEEKILFMNEVEIATRLSKQTILRFVREKKFPKPSKIGNKNAWYESTILDWIEEQMKSE